MSADLESKIAELTAQLKTAREDIDGLMMALGLWGIGQHKNPKERTLMVGGMIIRHPGCESEIDLSAHKDGACISMRPSGSSSTIIIETKADSSSVSVCAPDGRQDISLSTMPTGAAITVGDKKTPRAAQIYALEGRGHFALWDGAEAPGVVMAAGGKGSEVLVAHRTGKIAARLGDTETGGKLSLYHEDGTSSFAVLNEEGHSHVRMNPAGVVHSTTCISSGHGGDDIAGCIHLATSAGILQGSMFASEEGSGLMLGRKDGESVVFLTALQDYGSLALCSDGEKRKVEIDASLGQGSVCLSDEEGRRRVHLTAESEKPHIVMTDKEGVEVVSQTVTDAGSILHFIAPSGDNYLMLGVQAGQGMLHMGAEIEEPMLMLAAQPATGACVRLCGPDHTIHTEITSGTNGGMIVLNDELGQGRIRFCTVNDAGSIAMRWAGQSILTMTGNEKGGLIVAHGEGGEIRTTWPEAEAEAE